MSDKRTPPSLFGAAITILVIAALAFPAYVATYPSTKEVSPILLALGIASLAWIWLALLLFTVRAVVQLYRLRLEHPTWQLLFDAMRQSIRQTFRQHLSISVDVNVEAILKPYFLLPITKAGLLRLSVASYLMTIYIYGILYKFIAMGYPEAFYPKAIDLPTALYFSVVTIATVGFGDVYPTFSETKLLVSTEILSGVAYSVFFFSIIAGIVREPLSSSKAS